MTEQEIVQYLKDNMEKGIAFHFMPEDVRIWCLSSINYQKLLQFNGDSWDSTDDVFAGHKVDTTKVFSLPEVFKLEEKSKGKWVEFEIDQKGNFHRLMNGDMHYFFWANWNTFLAEAYSFGYTAFGGWQYENDERWYLAPAIQLKDGTVWNSYVIEECGEVKPVIPVKIRFWREIK